MKRRQFVATSTVAAAAVCALDSTLGAAATKEAALKLCSQEGRVPGESLKEKVEHLAAWGASAIEFGGDPRERLAEIKDALHGSGLKVSALCWGAHGGDLVSMDAERRAKGIAALKAALETAGELESTGVIFVPSFNKDSTLSAAELDAILFEILPAIGDHAVKCGSRILLEPLNKGEAYYLNRVGQAATICRKVNSPGICLMGDFYHMAKEETDQTQAFVDGGPWLHHVHLATGNSRILPAQEEHSYVAGFKGLKKAGYQDYCSLECGCKKGTDPLVEIPKAFEFLRKQWAEA